MENEELLKALKEQKKKQIEVIKTKEKINRLEAIMLLLDISEADALKRLSVSVRDTLEEMVILTDITYNIWSQHAKPDNPLSPIMTLRVKLASATMERKESLARIKTLEKEVEDFKCLMP